MPALALTDHGVMFGILHFYHAAKKADIRPIAGCEVYISPRTMTLVWARPCWALNFSSAPRLTGAFTGSSSASNGK